MKNYKTIIAMVAAGLVCTAATSNATLTTITAGGAAATPPPSDTSLFSGSPLATTTQNYSFGGGIDTGTIESLVYASGSGNTLGGYSFEYIVNVTSGDLSALNLNGFNVSTVLVGKEAGTDPISIGLALNGVINVSFGTSAPLLAGQTSTFLIDTGVKTYGGDNVGLQDNYPDGGAAILAPVPEPSTVVAGALMLLPFGIGAIRSLRKERAV